MYFPKPAGMLKTSVQAKIMDSWFKDTDVKRSYSRGYRIKYQTKCQKDTVIDTVYFKPHNHNTRTVKREEVEKSTGLNTS